MKVVAVLLLLGCCLLCSSLLPPSSFSTCRSVPAHVVSVAEVVPVHQYPFSPASVSRSSRFGSASATRLRGLFGLGGPEIAVIGVAAAFLLGPQKLAEFSKDLGKVAGELKDVPKEFQKGIKEGEEESKAMKAKQIEEVDEDE